MAGAYNRLDTVGYCARCGLAMREADATTITVNGVTLVMHAGCA